MTTQTLTAAKLADFTGSETHYVNPLFKYRYTDGVKYVAEHGRAWWLLDAIASWQLKLKRRKGLDFQVWTFRRTPSKGAYSAELVCSDGNNGRAAAQRIDYSDFPLDEITIYWIDGVMLLPSEY